MRNLRIYLFFCFLLVLDISSFGQSETELREGNVSFVSSQNIYVSFLSTAGINAGDTLFIQDGSLKPALIIKNLSSISCITETISNYAIERDSKVFAKIPRKVKVQQINDRNEEKTDSILLVKEERLERSKAIEKENREEKIYGRLSLKTYSNLSNSFNNNTRFRYTFSFNGEHLQQSKWSSDTYLVFTHKLGAWNKVQDNLFNALKIYSLAFKYHFNENQSLWVGRKINTNLANIGAIDGLQYEGSYNNLKWGLALGTRPDYSDYSINTSLGQVGAYVSHKIQNDHGFASSSFAFFNQNNGGKTDRRFIYLQHSNNLVDKLNLFTSCEIDLYKLENEVPTSTLQLTGLYLSLRYKPFKKLSLHTSYDARKNVIYYETFKNLADLIIENETRQGFRTQILYKPIKNSILSSTAGYRYKPGDLAPSKNLNSYFSYYKKVWIVDNMSLNHTWLSSSYLKGNQYAINFSRDIDKLNLYTTLNIRLVDYRFSYNNTRMFQKIANLSLNWKLKHNIQVSCDYEATLDDAFYSNLYFAVIKRFR